ncbi:MAG: CPBP family intramembrane metalloprotease [Actinomycetia bacterium]|nr:CPBP family intramembrane metalloprotease [Actinomycetes bacterium]
MAELASQYRSKLRRLLIRIVLVMLGFFAILIVSTMMVSAAWSFYIVSSLGIGPNDLSEFEAAIAASSGYINGITAIVGIVLGFLAMFGLRGKKLLAHDIGHVNGPVNIPVLLALAVMMLSTQGLVGYVSTVIDGLIGSFGPSLSDAYEAAIDTLMSPVGIVYIVLIGPVFEELIFRGAIMRSLERYGATFAIVISSLLFAAYHLILLQGVFAFAIGLLLGYAAYRFSLKWAILLHLLNNGFSLAITLAAANLAGANDGSLIMLGLAVNGLYFCCVIGTVLILVFRRQRIAEQLRVMQPVSMRLALGSPVDVPAGAPMADTTLASPPDPTPHPFRIAFSNPVFLGALLLALAISVGSMF